MTPQQQLLIPLRRSPWARTAQDVIYLQYPAVMSPPFAGSSKWAMSNCPREAEEYVFISLLFLPMSYNEGLLLQ